MKKRIWLVIAAVIIIGGAIVGDLIYKNKQAIHTESMNGTAMAMQAAATGSYSLNLMSGKVYSSNKPTTLRFDIQQNGQVFKNFAVDSTKLMHLIVVRKDRTNFQHVHPTYDSRTGIFTLSNFVFPTNGYYRVYANFAPTGAKKDVMGMVETEAPYEDVTVGNAESVTPLTLGADSLTSTMNGLTAMITDAPGGASPGTNLPTYYAGQDSDVGINLTRNGVAFTSLQDYLGNLGHMVILGPNLEFIHAHPTDNNLSNQTGRVPFMVTFPTSGQYKIYLQMQADNTLSTFDFNVTVQDMPQSSGSNSSDSMSGMGM